jgi:hypothetical protein
MCYSAQIEADYKKMAREFGATMDLSAFTELWLAENSPGPRKIPKALADSLLTHGPDSISQLVEARAAEQRLAWEADLFTQRKRLADAERKLASKPTKTAENSARIARDKMDHRSLSPPEPSRAVHPARRLGGAAVRRDSVVRSSSSSAVRPAMTCRPRSRTLPARQFPRSSGYSARAALGPRAQC